MLQDTRVLIIDGQVATIRLLRSILKRGGPNTSIKSTTNPRNALSYITEFQPDLIILNGQLPNIDGTTMLDHLRALIPPETYLPILVTAADLTPEAKQRVIRDGAADFLTKPFEGAEVLQRIRNLLEIRRLRQMITNETRVPVSPALEHGPEQDEAQVQLLQRMAVVAEYRDDLAGQHTRRVGETSAILAWALGLPESQAELIRRASPLHDIGKIAVPDRILLKPTGLTREEFEEMKVHTVIGARILSGSHLPVLKLAEEIALTHHENWDGSGYPLRLKGQAIPLAGRITAVADAYDAFTHDRPYRKALSGKEAWEIMWDGAGTQWDETVLEAFAASGIGRKPDRDATAVHEERRVLVTHLRR